MRKITYKPFMFQMGILLSLSVLVFFNTSQAKIRRIKPKVIQETTYSSTPPEENNVYVYTRDQTTGEYSLRAHHGLGKLLYVWDVISTVMPTGDYLYASKAGKNVHYKVKASFYKRGKILGLKVCFYPYQGGGSSAILLKEEAQQGLSGAEYFSPFIKGIDNQKEYELNHCEKIEPFTLPLKQDSESTEDYAKKIEKKVHADFCEAYNNLASRTTLSSDLISEIDLFGGNSNCENSKSGWIKRYTKRLAQTFKYYETNFLDKEIEAKQRTIKRKNNNLKIIEKLKRTGNDQLKKMAIAKNAILAYKKINNPTSTFNLPALKKTYLKALLSHMYTFAYKTNNSKKKRRFLKHIQNIISAPKDRVTAELTAFIRDISSDKQNEVKEQINALKKHYSGNINNLNADDISLIQIKQKPIYAKSLAALKAYIDQCQDCRTANGGVVTWLNNEKTPYQNEGAIGKLLNSSDFIDENSLVQKKKDILKKELYYTREIKQAKDDIKYLNELNTKFKSEVIQNIKGCDTVRVNEEGGVTTEGARVVKTQGKFCDSTTTTTICQSMVECTLETGNFFIPFRTITACQATDSKCPPAKKCVLSSHVDLHHGAYQRAFLDLLHKGKKAKLTRQETYQFLEPEKR